MNLIDEDNQKIKDKTSVELVKEVVKKNLSEISHPNFSINKPSSTGRAILTAFGYNHPGVVSAVTKTLSDANCDIQDISQKIMQEFFTMIMLIDITKSNKDLKDIQEEMNIISSHLGIKIFIQHEDVFRYMHRI